MAGKTRQIMFEIGGKLSGSFNQSFLSAAGQMERLAAKTSQFQTLQNKISAYQSESGKANSLGAQYGKSQQELARATAAMKATTAPTKEMQKEFDSLTQRTSKLKTALEQQREKLRGLRSELGQTGVNTRNLSGEQARLAQQSERVASAQSRLQASQAALAATQDKLSFNNIKGDLIASAGIALALRAPVMAAVNFEQAMAEVGAVSRASSQDMGILTAQARQLGRDTKFSASEAAGGQKFLAMAGFKTNQIVAAMPGLLDLAAASGMDLARTSDIASNILTGFRLEASQMNRVADVMALTMSASNTNVEQLGDAMKYVAPIAAAAGVSIEESAAMIGKMSDAGVQGSMAGTALRAALIRLAKEPKMTAEALAKIGLEAKDASGNLKPLPDMLQEIAKKTAQMGSGEQLEILAKIFGTEAAAGMQALMVSANDGSLKKLTEEAKMATREMQVLAYASKNVFTDADKSGKISYVNFGELEKGVSLVQSSSAAIGVSYDETAAIITRMVAAGFNGTVAGDQLNSAFNRLQKKPMVIAAGLSELSITAHDAKGNLKPFPKLLKEIGDKTKGMSKAKQLEILTKVFGKNGKESTEALRAMLDVARDGGFDDLIEQFEKVKGASGTMAERMNATAQGAMKRLSSASESLMIDIGNVLLPYFSEGAEKLAKFTGAMSALSQEFPVAAEIIVGGVAALGGIKIATVLGGIGWSMVKLPFQHAKVLIDGVSTAMTLWTTAAGANTAAQGLLNAAISANPIGAFITGVAGAIMIGWYLYNNWNDIVSYMDGLWNDFKNLFPGTAKFIEATLGGIVEIIMFPFNAAFYGVSEAISKLEAAWKKFMSLFSADVAKINSESISATVTVSEATVAGKITPQTFVHPDLQFNANGGIFNSPHLGVVAEAGAEAIIPLENKSRGIPLWKAAGDAMGLNFGGSSNITNSVTNSPVFNITVNGGEPGIEQRIADAVRRALEDLNNNERRVAFS